MGSRIVTPSRSSALSSAVYVGESGLISGREVVNGLAYHGSIGAFRAAQYAKLAEMERQHPDFRHATVLPTDAEKAFDGTIARAGRTRLNLVADMIAAGMVKPLPNWLGTPTLFYNKLTDVGYAQRAMIPKTRGERQIADITETGIPVFLTFDDFSFDIRTLLTANRAGYAIDTVHSEMATYNVNSAIEDQALYGLTDSAGNQFTIKGLSAPGFLTNPANTFTFVGGEGWAAAGHTGEEILTDIKAGIATLVADNKDGPYNLYVPLDYWLKLSDDYKSATSGTIMQRINELGNVTVKLLRSLPADTVLLIEMKPTTADIVLGQEPAMISWSDQNGWERYYVVLACAVTRLKSDADGGEGFAVGTPT